ncbi:hypothetical protein LINGRAHAP2_LOCUS14485 [Linum grandiflorum]
MALRTPLGKFNNYVPQLTIYVIYRLLLGMRSLLSKRI